MREMREQKLRRDVFKRLIEILERRKKWGEREQESEREIAISLFQDSLIQITESALVGRVKAEKTAKTKIKV